MQDCSISSQVSLTAHQYDGGGGGVGPELRHPDVDGTEESGNVGHLVAEQEHVSLAVSNLSRCVGTTVTCNEIFLELAMTENILESMTENILKSMTIIDTE